MKGLKGSKTEINLYKSFAEACRARSKYKMYCKQAKRDKYNCIADMFSDMEDCEYQCLKRMYEHFLGNVGDTEENLKMAIMCKENNMYKDCEKTAKEEGFEEIADFFKCLRKTMKEQVSMMKDVCKKLEDGTMYESDTEVNWLCTKCCYMAKGKMAPEKCPLCGARQGYFKKDECKYYDVMKKDMMYDMSDKDMECLFKVYVNAMTLKCVHECMVNGIEKCIYYLKGKDVSKKTCYAIYKDAMDKCMELIEELHMDLAESYDKKDMTHDELKDHIVECAMKCVDKMAKYMEKSCRKHINRKDEDEVIDGIKKICEKEKEKLYDYMMGMDMKDCYKNFMEVKDDYHMYMGKTPHEIKEMCKEKLEMMNKYMDNLNELGKELMEICMDILDEMDVPDKKKEEMEDYMMDKCMEYNKKMHHYVMEMYGMPMSMEECKEMLMKKYKKCVKGMKEMYMTMINDYVEDYDMMDMKEKMDKACEKYTEKMMKMM